MRHRATRAEEVLAEVDAASLEKAIKPLTSFLVAPSDLIGFLKVVEEFGKVVEEFLPIAADETAQRLTQLAGIAAQVTRGELRVTGCFPKAADSAIKHRKTLTDYYRNHPHYCIYWHRAEDPANVPHYRALLATALPVLYRLEKTRQNQPDPFQNHAYKFGLCLRQLTKAKGIERQILLELPIQAQPPEDLYQQLAALYSRFGIAPKTIGDYQGLAHISRVLLWYQTGEWETKRKFGKPPAISYKAPANSGAIETRHTEKRVALDVSSDDSAPTRTARYFERPDDQTAREEAFDHGMDLDNAPTATTVQLRPPRTANYFLANRRRTTRKNARYAAQAIELSNQHLPVTRSTLSGHELGIFLGALEDLSGEPWEEFPVGDRGKVAAWAACRFYLGRDETGLKGALSIQSQRADLADVVWDQDGRRFILRASPPHHAPPPADSVPLTVTVKQTFPLEISGIFLNVMGHVQKRSASLFGRSQENGYLRLIGKLNELHSINLTPTRLSAVVPHLMSQLAPADRVIGHYFLGMHPNQHNPAVYSVVPVRRLQTLFNHAVGLVEQKAGRGDRKTGTDSLPSLHSGDDDHVGSLHVPRAANVRDTVTVLKRSISEMAGSAITSVAELHNTYTAYVALFLLATTGVRAVSTLLPVVTDLDEFTGLCFMSDKDSPPYRNARLVWLHPGVVAQLKCYAQHVTRLRQHLAIANPSAIDGLDARFGIGPFSSHLSPNRTTDLEQLAKAAPILFMLSESGSQILPVMPSHLADYVGEDWKLRLAALRHFVRSHLLIVGCSGEVTNALLGHFDRGEAPWGEFSTLPPSIWRAQLSKAILPCIEGIGFEALTSPLLGTTSAVK